MYITRNKMFPKTFVSAAFIQIYSFKNAKSSSNHYY